MRDTRRASPEIGRGLRWTRIQCLSSPMMRIFMISSPPRRSARRFVRTVRRPSPGDTSPLPWEKGVELPPPSISVGQPDFYAEDEAGVWSSTTSRVELSPHSRNSSWVELSPHSRPSSNYARVELSPYFRSSTRVELSPVPRLAKRSASSSVSGSGGDAHVQALVTLPGMEGSTGWTLEDPQQGFMADDPGHAGDGTAVA